jgi:hypothetical protein
MDSLVPSVYTVGWYIRRSPQKVLRKVRDFPFLSDYIYDKGNRLLVW